MRIASYYCSNHQSSVFGKIKGKWFYVRYRRLGKRLGFSIGMNAFGYGLLIPHYGTIVINSGVRAGNYCVLHTSTCIGGPDKVIGNGLYLAAGAKVMGSLTLGDAVSIASNSLVNRSAPDHVLLAGMPAAIKRSDYPFWYDRDSPIYRERVNRVEALKKAMQIE